MALDYIIFDSILYVLLIALVAVLDNPSFQFIVMLGFAGFQLGIVSEAGPGFRWGCIISIADRLASRPMDQR